MLLRLANYDAAFKKPFSMTRFQVYSSKNLFFFNYDTERSMWYSSLLKRFRVYVDNQGCALLVENRYVYQKKSLREKIHKIWLGGAGADLFCSVSLWKQMPHLQVMNQTVVILGSTTMNTAIGRSGRLNLYFSLKAWKIGLTNGYILWKHCKEEYHWMCILILYKVDIYYGGGLVWRIAHLKDGKVEVRIKSDKWMDYRNAYCWMYPQMVLLFSAGYCTSA